MLDLFTRKTLVNFAFMCSCFNAVIVGRLPHTGQYDIGAIIQRFVISGTSGFSPFVLYLNAVLPTQMILILK